MCGLFFANPLPCPPPPGVPLLYPNPPTLTSLQRNNRQQWVPFTVRMKGLPEGAPCDEARR